MKTHYHDEQFDGQMHAWCGKNGNVVSTEVFEATKPEDRCKLCERDWFPFGQPSWHLDGAKYNTRKK